MFNRFTRGFISLSERDQLSLLRKMIEGDLDLDVVLHAESLNGISGLLRHGDQIASFASQTDALVRRTNQILGKSKGMDIVDDYKSITIQARQEKCEEYERKLRGADEVALREFKHVCDRDSAVVAAMEVLVTIFACKLYNIGSMSTSDQCVIMNHLKANPFAVVKTSNNDARAAIDSFQKLFDILMHSYISDDVKAFLKTAATHLFGNEVVMRTQMNKTIMLLISMKERIDAEVPSHSTPGFFNKTTHGHAREVSAMINDVISGSINILDSRENKHVAAIKNAFVNIYQIVKSEECGALRRRSFWDDMFDQMNTVIAEENHFLQMDVQQGRNLRK